MLNVLGLGDNVVDVYLHTNTMYPGGNALNFAVFARQLGYSSAYLGVFGDDAPAAHVYQVAVHWDWI
ncbi:MAG: PfkB family carbohydrate kinase [Clostridiales bacterium]|nr:PfkB family carbohydrate kinase [Clostridiales bacterium]